MGLVKLYIIMLVMLSKMKMPVWWFCVAIDSGVECE